MMKSKVLYVMFTLLLFVSHSFAEEKLKAETPTFTRKEVTSTAAWKLIEAVMAEARSRGEIVAVAVSDLGGHPIAFLRMDEAKPAVVKIAIDKAYSSAIYRASTGKLWELAQPGEPAYGLAEVERTITFKGGLPILHKGVVVGAVGVSGAAAHIDEEIAIAAIEKVFGNQDSETSNE